MRMSFIQYAQSSIASFKEGIVNLFMFFPYFFSVGTMAKTLFSPWKNLTAHKTQLGFTFSEWFDRLMFNITSRGMGFFMRLSILLFYLMLQMFFVISLPFIFLIFLVLLPFTYLLYSLQKTDEEKKAQMKQRFLATHILDPQHTSLGDEWFESYYRQYYAKIEWWKLANLYSVPPIGRDWVSGYTPTLDEYAIDLGTEEYQKDFTHLVDRQKEIEQIERVLSRSDEANVIIAGEDGVGKHTILDALAKKIYEGKTTTPLMYKRILKLNMEKILTKYTDTKQREEFLEELFKEASVANNVILCIDEIHKYLSEGPQHVNMEGPISKYAKTAHLQFIGITTPFSYQKFIAPVESLSRIFPKIDVYEVGMEDALTILLEHTWVYETRYRVNIPYETIIACIQKSDYYITSIPFPEKAMQLLDSACVYTVQTLKKTLVLPEYVDTVLSERTHIPTQLSEDLKTKLVTLEQLLDARIINQHQAAADIASALRRSFLTMGKRKKPLATFMFLGPTGVGKTETAKTIAEVFFGSQSYLMRFDMSAYQTKESIAQLIGSSETGNPGLLTKTVREQPYGVLLLDELEKAEKDLFNIFLTLLDEGYFTDSYGKRVDCKNLVVIATSNAASDFIFSSVHEGKVVTSDSIMNKLIDEHIFSPEFLNRFDGVIAFNPLNNSDVAILGKRMLEGIASSIEKMYGVHLSVSPDTLDKIISVGYNEAFGARDLERALRHEVEDTVAKKILSNELKAGDSVTL